MDKLLLIDDEPDVPRYFGNVGRRFVTVQLCGLEPGFQRHVHDTSRVFVAEHADRQDFRGQAARDVVDTLRCDLPG